MNPYSVHSIIIIAHEYVHDVDVLSCYGNSTKKIFLK